MTSKIDLRPEAQTTVYVGLRSGGVLTITRPANEVDVSQVKLEDIAHGLAGEYRFSNQLHRPVTVAEHSVLGSYLFPDDPPLQLQFMFHDAAEGLGYGDMSGPLKATLPAEVKEVEAAVQKAVFDLYGIDWPLDDRVAEADRIVGSVEYSMLHPARGRLQQTGYVPHPVPAGYPLAHVRQRLNQSPPKDPAAEWLTRLNDIHRHMRNKEVLVGLLTPSLRDGGDRGYLETAFRTRMANTHGASEAEVATAIEGMVRSGLAERRGHLLVSTNPAWRDKR